MLPSDLFKDCHEYCKGCSILKKNKPVHTVQDYKKLKPGRILFISDSFKYNQHNYRAYPFRSEETALIKDTLEKVGHEEWIPEVRYTASVKCPGVRDSDMKKEDRERCRLHLQETIDVVKPDLVFACGNLALIMLTKYSGVLTRRGKQYAYETPNGTKTTIVGLFHPYQVVVEPKNNYLFSLDIKNAIDDVLLEKSKISGFGFDLVQDSEAMKEYAPGIIESGIMSVDIETEGLNFLKDRILTISFSWREGKEIKTAVIPVFHKDSQIPKDELRKILVEFYKLMVNKNVRKVFHEAKFDLKFLHRLGIEVYNVWDTKLMQHIVDENLPKRLKDLVEYYFPHEFRDVNSRESG